MFRRRSGRGAQQAASKGCPHSGGLRRRLPRLPKLTAPELRGARGARGAGASRVPRGCASWWQEMDTEPDVDVRGGSPRLPALATETPRAARSRSGLRSLLLPPLLSAGSPCGSASRLPPPREGEAPDSLGAFLGGLLPGKFREFLQQLYRKCADSPEPETDSAPQQQRGVSEYCRVSPSPSCQVLPDLWDQSSNFQDRLKKILFHQIPVLGHRRGDHSQFATVRQANQLHGTQASKVKAALSPCSSREGLAARRRSCPFRVRFADETLRDSALRYWERCCAALQPDSDTGTTTLPVVTERVLGSVGRWLEGLPKPLHPGAQEAAGASSSCWDHPSLLSEEVQNSFSKDTSMNNSLSFVPKATTQSQWGDLTNSLDSKHLMEQESLLPSLVLQSVLKRGRPKGYQLLLPPKASQRAQR